MSIRKQHLSIRPDGKSWLNVSDGWRDATNDRTFLLDLLSVVRHIMRERGDCNIIPIIRTVTVGPTNEYGHNMVVEVTYHTSGYRAIYGVTLNGFVQGVSCYMD